MQMRASNLWTKFEALSSVDLGRKQHRDLYRALYRAYHCKEAIGQVGAGDTKEVMAGDIAEGSGWQVLMQGQSVL